MRGQMYTLEALLASLIIFGAVVFAMKTAPRFGTETKEFTTLQLKKYADDILELLDLERGDHTSLLSDITSNRTLFEITFKRISETLVGNLSVMLRAEVLYPNGTVKYSYGPIPPRGAVSSFRVVPSISPPYAYEVRLYLWHV